MSYETLGKHYKIPPCCRQWFITWTKICTREYMYGSTIHLLKWGYIPCPGCRHCIASARKMYRDELKMWRLNKHLEKLRRQQTRD